MTQTQLQMSDLYQRLDAIGFPKKYLQNKILPDWWTDDVDATSGFWLRVLCISQGG